VILLSALVIGLLVGLGWSRWRNQPYQAPPLQSMWLVLVAFLPQLVVAYLPFSRYLLPDWLAASSLAASLIVFLAFVWLNRRLPGMPILIIGLGLNLIVILANRGWMPISPLTASHLVSGNVNQSFSVGSRFGQKDILLLPQDMQFEILADRFLLPGWFPYQVAFSLGDILIALGVFWLLAKPAGQTESQRS
jgi:hypothetical protein